MSWMFAFFNWWFIIYLLLPEVNSKLLNRPSEQTTLNKSLVFIYLFILFLNSFQRSQFLILSTLYYKNLTIFWGGILWRFSLQKQDFSCLLFPKQLPVTPQKELLEEPCKARRSKWDGKTGTIVHPPSTREAIVEYEALDFSL